MHGGDCGGNPSCRHQGPLSRGEYGGKISRTAVLSTRLQPDTRGRLSRAAKASGRSLSQELEHRLRASFIDEDKVVDFYGSESTGAVVKLLGAVIQSTCTNWFVKTGDDWTPDLRRDAGEWLRDGKLFDQVLTAVVHALTWFRPTNGRDENILSPYHSAVEDLINEIRVADPSIPIMKRSKRQHAMAMLKDQLGELVPIDPSHDHWRKNTPERVAPKAIKRKV